MSVWGWEAHGQALPGMALARSFHPSYFETLELFLCYLQQVLNFVVKIQAKVFSFLIFQTVVLVVFLVMVNFFLLLLLEN